MAQRAKAKKAASSATSGAATGKRKAAARSADSGTTSAAGGESPSVAALQAECSSLRQELEAARAEIARLQKRQELVVNRIDWVIDSLHNLVDDEA